MSTSMREALEKLDDAARGFGWNSDQYRARWKEVQAALSSPRAETWECVGRKQAYPEPGECDWPGCGCDPNATKVIESFLEQNWKPPLDRKAVTAALKPFSAISVYEDDDSAPVTVIVNHRISYDFTLGDFRALQSADAIMRETR